MSSRPAFHRAMRGKWIFFYAGVHPRSSQFMALPPAAHVSQPMVACQEFLLQSQKREARQSADGNLLK